MNQPLSPSWSFHNLLLWLLLYLLVSPVLATLPSTHIFVSLLLTAVLFFSVYTVNRGNNILFRGAFVLMGLTLVLFWVNVFELIVLSQLTSSFLLCCYFGLLVYSLTRVLFAAQKITASLVSGALCLYLLFGIFWGSLFNLVELLQPNSFGGELLTNSLSSIEHRHYLQYFSFVTLTTLGYGDILPQTAVATALCQVEAIIGQFFMAVLVARFVGIQVAQEFSGKG